MFKDEFIGLIDRDGVNIHEGHTVDMIHPQNGNIVNSGVVRYSKCACWCVFDGNQELPFKGTNDGAAPFLRVSHGG